MRTTLFLSVSIYAAATSLFLSVARAGDAFTTEIKPLLSNRCFACHGPDEHAREADLRLDTFDGATKDLGDYSAIVPGNSEISELIARVVSEDPDIRMPPPEFGDALTSDDITKLRNWITNGAEYKTHWSYVPSARIATSNAPSSIDGFVQRKLTEHGLEPSRQAAPYLLVRRVALDLTGLPPTLEQADRFAANPTENEYERLVDELLASKRYGEHWASMWLDVARYADSAGYADDPLRTIWGYRDYVIRAFNENRRFDDFTVEQLAGDMLPSPTQEQLIATAFHRNTLTNNEGGTDDEEFRNAAIVDRVNTTASAWLGTTFACCQCHDHKYDPISQEEYFKLFAIFNQSEDTDKKDERPFLSIRTDEQLQRVEQFRTQLADVTSQLDAAEAGLRERLASWEAALSDKSFEPIEGRYVRVDIPNREAFLSLAEVQVFSGEENVASKGKASQSSNSSGGFAPKGIDGNTSGRFNADASTTHTTYEKHPWWEVDLKAVKAINAIAVWNRVGEDNGGTRNDGIGGRLKGYRVQVLDKGRRVVWQMDGQSIPDPSERFGLSGLSDDIKQALGTTTADRTDAEWKLLEATFANYDPVRTPLLAEQDRLQWAIRNGMKPATTVPVMRELAEQKSRETHIHIRGNFQSLGAKVESGTPEYLPPLPDGVAPNRLSLAKWLVDDANPLTSRVLANRIWSRLFGRGLVPTVEDFGSQGDLPTHPQLLDWLSLELVDTGWDIKALLKTIVMSQTYRQSAEVSESARAADPANEWLARGPRFRISAEIVRDQALAASGLLSSKMYGPPVHPPQPKTGLKAAFGTTLEWKNSTGEDRYRRAVYTEIRRSLPFPDMQIMDAPNREVCTNERSRTNTPLQAFLTLNGEVYVEAAEALAKRVVTTAADDDERMTLAFRLCLIRPPATEEQRRLNELLAESQKFYSENSAQTDAAISEPIDGISKVDLAAWTSVCSVIMNLDEVFLRP